MTTISNLPLLSTATSTVVFPVVEDGVTKQATFNQIKDFALDGIVVTPNTLVNGDYDVILDANGILNFSNGGQVGPTTAENAINLKATAGMLWAEINYNEDQYVWVDPNAAYIGVNYLNTATVWAFNKDGVLDIPLNGDIKRGGVSVLGGGTTSTGVSISIDGGDSTTVFDGTDIIFDGGGA